MVGSIWPCASSVEASPLSDLALCSKALWGYDAAFLADCQAALTLAPDEIATSPVFLVEEQGRIVGFYGLRGAPPDAELSYLFVEPVAIGQGYGRRLWRHALDTARGLGFRRLLIESDPNAEAFYQAMGAVRVGKVPSSVRPGGSCRCWSSFYL